MNKNGFSSCLAIGLLTFLLMFQTFDMNVSTVLFASSTGDAVSISDLLSETATQPTSESSTVKNSSTDDDDDNNDIISDITSNLDYSKGNNEIVKQAGQTINYYVGVAVQILTYVITAALTVCKLLDIAYIAIPPFRKYLANGYVGNAAVAGTQRQGMMNSPMAGGGMMNNPMAGGMMNNPMAGGMYGRGRYGMGMNGAMGMQADGQMAANNQPALGRIQLVSNAALNAVATESVLGTDGKGQSAWKVYFSDMLVNCVVVGILIILCLTGVMTKFGFVIGDFIVNTVSKISLGV